MELSAGELYPVSVATVTRVQRQRHHRYALERWNDVYLYPGRNIGGLRFGPVWPRRCYRWNGPLADATEYAREYRDDAVRGEPSFIERAQSIHNKLGNGHRRASLGMAGFACICP